MRQKSFSYIHALATIGLAFMCCCYVKISNGTRQVMANRGMMALEESSTAGGTRTLVDQAPAVIVAVIHRDTDLSELCLSMRTLSNIQGSLTAPVHIFHLGHVQKSVREENKIFLQSCTDRHVYSNVVDTSTFPTGFVPEDGRDYFSSFINRFWTTQIWEHPALEPFEIIMKIDDDVCFSMPNSDLPYFKSSHHDYFSHHFPGTVELNRGNLDNMYEYSHNYIVENELVVGHEALWQIVDYTHKDTEGLPTFVYSFEVVRKSFMLRSDVYDWHHALTEMPPYGYFSRGWTAGAERFLTMAIFGTPSSVDGTLVRGFLQKNLGSGNSHDKVCTLPFEESVSL